ncbi:MAG: hypothetical protein WC122_01200 [archaeon]
MENQTRVPLSPAKPFQKFKNLLKNHYLEIFLALTFLYFLGAFFRINAHVGCPDDIISYVYEYLIVILLPFILFSSTMLSERKRNILIGRDSTNSFLYILQSCVMAIFFIGILFIVCMAFFSSPECGKLGDDYSFYVLLIAAIYGCLLVGYLIILFLTWIVRAIKK